MVENPFIRDLLHYGAAYVISPVGNMQVKKCVKILKVSKELTLNEEVNSVYTIAYDTLVSDFQGITISNSPSPETLTASIRDLMGMVYPMSLQAMSVWMLEGVHKLQTACIEEDPGDELPF